MTTNPDAQRRASSSTVVRDSSPARAEAIVVSVNVGQPRTIEWHGRAITSAIWKEPVHEPVPLHGDNLRGDDQADRRVHGGPDKAVYAYAAEDYQWWSSSIGPLAPGTFGENLTTRGIDLTASRVGDRWRVGAAELQVTQPRSPCFKLAMRMNDPTFPDRFTAARRPGCYLRILRGGQIAAGDRIDVVQAEEPAVTIADLAADDIPLDVLRQIIRDNRLPDGWHRSAARTLRRVARGTTPPPSTQA